MSDQGIARVCNYAWDDSLKKWTYQKASPTVVVSGIVNAYDVGVTSSRTPITVSGTSSTPIMVSITGGNRTIEIHNSGGSDIYYGGSTAGPTSGIPIFADVTKTWSNVTSNFSVYLGIADGDSADVRIVEYV